MSKRALVQPTPPVNSLTVRETREFTGGWNTLDGPDNLSSRYLTELRNLYPDSNGRLRLRYGTSLFADLAGYVDEVIAIEYYNATLIAVSADGRVVSIDGTGAVTVRWNSTIASNKGVGNWSTGLTFASFTQFVGNLIICNGIDKPLVMGPTFDVNYLADLGSGSNANVPRAKFCTTHNNYLILAVTPTDKTTLYIGMRGAIGTFYGDPGVDNDGVNFVTNTYISRGSPDITGLATFRDQLIVSFAETIISITLGQYEGTSPPKHVPKVSDTIENHGAVSHRAIVPLGDDILFLDSTGTSSIKRALVTGALSPVRESTLIGVDIQRAMASFTPAQLEQYVFAVHDRTAQHVLFFVPKTPAVDVATDNNVFVFCFDRSQKFRAWTYFDQMAYRCGTRSTEGRVFLAAGVKVFFYHNQYEPLHNDYAGVGNYTWDDGTLWEGGFYWETVGVLGQQPWDTGQLWDDDTGWEAIVNTVGTPIPFSFTIPWTDLKSAGLIKLSKYASVRAEGAGQFQLQMFIDQFEDAALTLDMTMTDVPSTYKQAVRPANNAQLYSWPAKFERMRFRVSGNADAYIAFVALRIMYLVGSIRR